MKKKTPILDLYYQWMEVGEIPDKGLCLTVLPALSPDFNLFIPDSSEFPEHYERAPVTGGFWAYDGDPLGAFNFAISDCRKRGITTSDAYCSFTPMRQTIVLFCAAMNDEL